MAQENVPVKVGILELLGGANGAQFVIPAYQRNYTWTAKKEVTQLLEDLFAVLRSERSKHFVGIMIYLEKPISPFQWERSVIDGQQRLTTIFLTLYAIKELMIEKGESISAEKLENCYLINPYNETNKYKLKPLVSDDEVYQHIVRRDFTNIPDRNSNVYRNFIYIKEILREVSRTFSLDDILFAINKLYIVCVPISNDDYPQKIFESINATGSKLTASDLIRNFLLMPIVSDLQDDYYARYWKQVETLVDYDSKKLEAFFRFFVMAKKKNLVKKSDVYQSFTKWYDGCKEELGVENIFIEIVNYAKCYNHLYKAPMDKLDIALRQPIFEFRLILSDMPAPLLMELYCIYMKTDSNSKHVLSAQQLAEVITILNSYLMRRSLCDMDTSAISAYFPELLKNLISSCNGEYSSIVEVFKRLLINNNRFNAREMPDDKRLMERIKYANMYSLSHWVSILFRKMESEGNPAPVDFSALSIEHLMPQTPNSLWLNSLGCDKETYANNVNRLGNLTLAAKPDNSRMSNHMWEYKNRILASTNHLKINTKLLELEKWKIEDIEERTIELINEIARLYPYFASNTNEHTYKIPVYLDDPSVKANGFYYPETKSMEITAGTTLKDINNDSRIANIVSAFREKLLEDGTLAIFDGNYVFAENMIFDRENALDLSATVILVDHITDGETRWRTTDGYTIRDWERENTSLIEGLNDIRILSDIGGSNESITSNGNGEKYLQEKIVDWSFFTSAITLSNETREEIQSRKDWRLRIKENRNIKIIVDGEAYDSVLTLYNYDHRPNPVMQIRSSAKLKEVLREKCSDKYKELLEKRSHKERGLEFKERIVRYVHIYATDSPNTFRFKFR